jgi:hypothetical protein
MIKGESSLMQLKDGVTSFSLWFASHIPFFMIFVSNYKQGIHIVRIEYPKLQNIGNCAMPRLNPNSLHVPKWDSKFQVQSVSLKDMNVLFISYIYIYIYIMKPESLNLSIASKYPITKSQKPISLYTLIQNTHILRDIFDSFLTSNFPPLISTMDVTQIHLLASFVNQVEILS